MNSSKCNLFKALPLCQKQRGSENLILLKLTHFGFYWLAFAVLPDKMQNCFQLCWKFLSVVCTILPSVVAGWVWWSISFQCRASSMCSISSQVLWLLIHVRKFTRRPGVVECRKLVPKAGHSKVVSTLSVTMKKWRDCFSLKLTGNSVLLAICASEWSFWLFQH